VGISAISAGFCPFWHRSSIRLRWRALTGRPRAYDLGEFRQAPPGSE
jgi:hypothetical protein